ncbi:MAG: CDP-alcohol phosphatidyltransferase family protein [Phycisphaeraceae bacterium]
MDTRAFSIRHLIRKLTPATLVTLSRAVMAGLFVRAGRRGEMVLAGLAGLSDMVDGALARRMNSTDNVGAIADSVADKIFTGSVMLKMLRRSAIPLPMAALLLTRDLMVTTLGAIVFSGRAKIDLGRGRPGWLSKSATGGLFLLLLSLLVWPGGRKRAQRGLMTLTAGLSVAAATEFLVRFLREAEWPERGATKKVPPTRPGSAAAPPGPHRERLGREGRPADPGGRSGVSRPEPRG